MAGADGSVQADRARADLERLRQMLNKELRDLLLRLDTESGESTLARGRDALATAQRTRAQVMQLLERAGTVVVDVAEQATVDAALAVAKDVELGDFNPEAGVALEQIVKGQLDEVTKTFGDGAERVRRAVTVATTTGAPLSELIDEVAQAVDTTFLRAQAAVDSAVMGAGRYVTLRAADGVGVDGDPIVFLIVGPRDGKVRDWCRAHVGKAFSEDALDRDDNGAGQPKPASVYLGGYNCRHSLAPMLSSQAVAEGIEVVL